MKISIEIDATPEEVRECFGWPPMQQFHEELMRIVQENMKKGVSGFDPMTLMQALVPTGCRTDPEGLLRRPETQRGEAHERGIGPGSEVAHARGAVRGAA